MSLADEILAAASPAFDKKQYLYFAAQVTPKSWPDEDNSEPRLLAAIMPRLNTHIERLHQAEINQGVTLALSNVAVTAYGLEGKLEVDLDKLIFPIDRANRTTMHELSSSASGTASEIIRWYLTTHQQPNGALYIECSRADFKQHIYQAVLAKFNGALERFLKMKARIENASAPELAKIYLDELFEAETLEPRSENQ